MGEYAPAYKVFNTSTLSFAGNDVGSLEDIEWHIGGQKVDIGSALDAMKLYGQGLDDPEISFTVKGVTSIARGDQGELSVTWNDEDDTGPCEPLTNALVNDVIVSGSKDQAITSKIVIVPAPTDA